MTPSYCSYWSRNSFSSWDCGWCMYDLAVDISISLLFINAFTLSNETFHLLQTRMLLFLTFFYSHIEKPCMGYYDYYVYIHRVFKTVFWGFFYSLSKFRNAGLITFCICIIFYSNLGLVVRIIECTLVALICYGFWQIYFFLEISSHHEVERLNSGWLYCTLIRD